MWTIACLLCCDSSDCACWSRVCLHPFTRFRQQEANWSHRFKTYKSVLRHVTKTSFFFSEELHGPQKWDRHGPKFCRLANNEFGDGWDMAMHQKTCFSNLAFFGPWDAFWIGAAKSKYCRGPRIAEPGVTAGFTGGAALPRRDEKKRYSAAFGKLIAERQNTVSALNSLFDQRDELQRFKRRLLHCGTSVFWSDSARTAEGDRQRECLPLASVFFFLVAVSLCSGAVLEQAVVGQALVNSSLVFSTDLKATTHTKQNNIGWKNNSAQNLGWIDRWESRPAGKKRVKKKEKRAEVRRKLKKTVGNQTKKVNGKTNSNVKWPKQSLRALVRKMITCNRRTYNRDWGAQAWSCRLDGHTDTEWARETVRLAQGKDFKILIFMAPARMRNIGGAFEPKSPPEKEGRESSTAEEEKHHPNKGCERRTTQSSTTHKGRGRNATQSSGGEGRQHHQNEEDVTETLPRRTMRSNTTQNNEWKQHPLQGKEGKGNHTKDGGRESHTTRAEEGESNTTQWRRTQTTRRKRRRRVKQHHTPEGEITKLKLPKKYQSKMTKKTK